MPAPPFGLPVRQAVSLRSAVADQPFGPGLFGEKIGRIPDHAPLRHAGRRDARARRKSLPVNSVDFRGTIQCDGYEAYDCFAKRRGDRIVLAG